MILFECVAAYWKEVLISVLTLLFAIFAFFKYKFSYWQRSGFPCVQGSTIPWGSLADFILMKQSISKTLSKVYNESREHMYVGYYSLWTPTLMIRDPELARKVMVKDFDTFADRGMYYNDKDDPLSSHLFALDGIRWKTTRSKLNPMFGASKIKLMFVTMKVCALQLQEHLKETLNQRDNVILDIKDLTSRHAINVIANTAIGIEGHSFKGESELHHIASKATEPTMIQGFRFGLAMLSKDFAKLIRMRFTPKSIESYYLDMAKQIVEYRNKNNILRNDFMGMLIQLWNKETSYEAQLKPEDETKLSLRDIAAQTFLFILAAYESTASTMCFALYELAYNKKIQEKLQVEVDSIESTEEITYEQLVNMKYLTMVLNETWRKYPPGGMILRECQKDYELPDGRVLKKGITVTIPVDGFHNDPELFPDPDIFDPERFNKDSPSQSIPLYAYIPFGEGQRNCIGKRYGIVQSMLTLFTLVSTCRFEITEETQVPPKIDPKVFVTQSEGGMPLRFIRRK